MAQGVVGDGELRLSPTEKLVLICLAAHADGRGQSWPSWARMQTFCCCSRASIHRSIGRLREIGVVSYQRRTNEAGKPSSNLYQLDARRLRKLSRSKAREEGVRSHGETTTEGSHGETSRGLMVRPQGEFRGLTLRREGSHAETGRGLMLRREGSHAETLTLPMNSTNGTLPGKEEGSPPPPSNEFQRSMEDVFGDDPDDVASKLSHLPQSTNEAVDPGRNPFVVKDQIVEAWNAMAAKAGLNESVEILGGRLHKLRECLRSDQFAQRWREVISIIPDSDFLCGRVPGKGGAPPFRASLDWLLRDDNWLAVLERKYHDKRAAATSKPTTVLEALRGRR